MGFRWKGRGFYSIFIAGINGIKIQNSRISLLFPSFFFFFSFGKTSIRRRPEFWQNRTRWRAEIPILMNAFRGTWVAYVSSQWRLASSTNQRIPLNCRNFLPTGSSLLLLPPPLFLEIGCIRFTVSNTLARNHYYHHSFITFACVVFFFFFFPKSNSTAKMNILVYIIYV